MQVTQGEARALGEFFVNEGLQGRRHNYAMVACPLCQNSVFVSRSPAVGLPGDAVEVLGHERAAAMEMAGHIRSAHGGSTMCRDPISGEWLEGDIAGLIEMAHGRGWKRS